MNNMLEYFVTARDMTDKGLRQVRRRFIDTTRKIANDAQRSLGFGNIEQSLIRGVFGGNLLMQGARMAVNFTKELFFANKEVEDLSRNFSKVWNSLKNIINAPIRKAAEAWNYALFGEISGGVKVTSTATMQTRTRTGYGKQFEYEYGRSESERQQDKLLKELAEQVVMYKELMFKAKTTAEVESLRIDMMRKELAVAEQLGYEWENVAEQAEKVNDYLREQGAAFRYNQYDWNKAGREKEQQINYLANLERMESEKAERMQAFNNERNKIRKKLDAENRDRNIKNLQKERDEIKKNLLEEQKRLDIAAQQARIKAEELNDESARLKYLALNKGALRAEQRAQREAQKEDRRYQSILANVQRKLNANARRHGRFGIPLSDTEKAALGSERARAEATRLEAQAQELDRNSKQAQIDAANALARIETAVDKLVNEAVEGD